MILKAVVDALDKRGIPRPDEKLKRIVGAQVSTLLRGGYPAEQIRHFAVELALSWDNAKGHQRLLGLRQTVLQDDAEIEYKAHKERKREAANDLIPADPAVAIAMLNAAKRHLGHRGGRVAWTVGCASRGCTRTAVYATATCAEHGEAIPVTPRDSSALPMQTPIVPVHSSPLPPSPTGEKAWDQDPNFQVKTS